MTTVYIGVDFHPHQQTVCWCDPATGEIKIQTLHHQHGEVQRFYQQLPPAIIGMEATTQAVWFEQLLFDNHHQLRVGNPKLIRARATSRHKSDARDAELLFDLLRRDEFPTLWRRPSTSTEVLDSTRVSALRPVQTFYELVARNERMNFFSKNPPFFPALSGELGGVCFFPKISA